MESNVIKQKKSSEHSGVGYVIALGVSLLYGMAVTDHGTWNPVEMYRMHKKMQFYSSFFDKNEGRFSQTGRDSVRSWLGKDSVLYDAIASNPDAIPYEKSFTILEKAVTNHFTNIQATDSVTVCQKRRIEDFKREYE